MKNWIYLAICFMLVSTYGCAFTKQVSSEVSPIFLDDVDTTKQLDNMPFNHSWVWVEKDPNYYRSVLIKPIRMDKLSEDNWKKSISVFLSSKEAYDEKANEIAAYFYEQLVKQITENPNPSITLVQEPGPGVLIAEIAFTELEFSHPLTHAGALAVPLPAADQALSAFSNPHAAFAVRLSDSQTGELIATAADRKFPPVRIIDLNKVTVSSSIKEICKFWSKELASALNQGRLGKVKRVGLFRLLPW